MTDRRVVRVSPSFFEDLDRLLPAERGPRGEPARVDFLSIELIDLIEHFAVRFDTLAPLVEGRPDYRVLIKTGTLVLGISVVGQLMPDGAVELLRLELDLRMDWS